MMHFSPPRKAGGKSASPRSDGKTGNYFGGAGNFGAGTGNFHQPKPKSSLDEVFGTHRCAEAFGRVCLIHGSTFYHFIEALIHRLRDFPKEALSELFLALDVIEKKYDLLKELTDEEKQAIDEGKKSFERGEGIPMEEVMKKFGLENYDRDAAGKSDFSEAVSRIKKMSGEQQGDAANVLYALLDQYGWDVEPAASEGK